MPKFGKRSLARLNTCDAEIQVLFEEIVKHFDCTVLCGHRPKDKQDDLQGYDPPRTKVSWPNSLVYAYVGVEIGTPILK